MEIRQLEAFAAVYSAGSVTAAGRLLDRSQPMVSRQIQDLEQELGFMLFTRTRPQVTLTEQGREYYEEVRNVLAGLQQLDSRSREIAGGQSRPLRVAATYSLGSSLLPTTIGLLERSQPVFEYKLYIDTFQPHDVVQAVADGQADIGVISLPIDLGRCELLWSGQAPCVLALPANHPLAASTVVRLSELGDNTVITMSNRTGLRHRLSTALLHNNPTARPRRQIETTSSLSALMMVRAGVGVALVDPLTATTMSPEGVVFRGIDRHVPYLMGVIKHRDRTLPDEGSRLVQAMWDYASANVPRFVAGDPSGLPKDADPFQPAPDKDAA
ncbi:LysR family transcriptional regulator [Pollutimonas sp. H1-120]|uniref:LysR family transcriptional regulator n=1 Tax=Pollutimonas sp. H1-120 TaxID=3148824 RepID=UPI003B51BBBB